MKLYKQTISDTLYCPWDNVAYNIAVGKYGGQEIDKIVSFP